MIDRAIRSVSAKGPSRRIGCAPAAVLALFVTSCAGPSWRAGRAMLAPTYRVATALGEPAFEEPLVGEAVPRVEPPRGVRTCCAFGMDLAVRYRGVPVPLYRVGNVTENEALARHEYDHGAIALRAGERGIEREHDGLIYTCRGGWVDTAHVRDNADLTFYLTSEILRALPGPAVIEPPGDGAARRIELREVPRELLARNGRFETAATIASWIAFRYSVWHEIASWYGWESVAGYSERVSTFSPEDLYSNELGIRVGVAVAREGGLVSRESYNVLTEAWVSAVIDRLGPLRVREGRAVMTALDRHWWDSSRVLPEVALVSRRNLDVAEVLRPWRVDDALDEGAIPQGVRAACAGRRALALRVIDRVADVPIERLVGLTWVPESWAGESFPWPRAGVREVRNEDLEGLVRTVREGLRGALGDGFDRPR